MPSNPLHNARHEAFALAIAAGHRLVAAYQCAGFTSKDPKQAWLLRHRPEVNARVEWLLNERVRRDTKRFVRHQKKIEDLQLAALEELKNIAFADVREVAQWGPKPTFSPDGDLIGIEEQVRVTPADQLSEAAAASIKGVFAKAGGVRLELHDKRQALVDILKITGAFKDDRPPAASLTVNQVNIGHMNAIDAARRVAFLIRSATALAPTAPQLIGEQPAPDEAKAQSDKS
jgi:hypothetical protein